MADWVSVLGATSVWSVKRYSMGVRYEAIHQGSR